ncbi:MAG: hypothetical protein SGPRY_007352 [Prymnesium sp.]
MADAFDFGRFQFSPPKRRVGATHPARIARAAEALLPPSSAPPLPSSPHRVDPSHVNSTPPRHPSSALLTKTRAPVDVSSSPSESATLLSREQHLSRALAELELIQAYRSVAAASVDAFHSFLLSLGESEQGRYWALVACLLSVQCRDSVALEATRRLMRAAPAGAKDVASLPEEELTTLVRSCNYYIGKARKVRGSSEAILRAGGRVPNSYEALVALPGVGPKIAHLMLSVAFSDEGSGIVVDTHVHRVARKLGWVDSMAARSGPEATRRELQVWVPRASWTAFSLAVVGFGQLTQSGRAWGPRFVAHVERGGSSDAVHLARSIVQRIDDPQKEAESFPPAPMIASHAECNLEKLQSQTPPSLSSSQLTANAQLSPCIARQREPMAGRETQAVLHGFLSFNNNRDGRVASSKRSLESHAGASEQCTKAEALHKRGRVSKLCAAITELNDDDNAFE